MRLVIAEKPSVAQSLSRVLGASARRDGYLEGGGYLVSWCVGHLVELAPADSYDAKYSKWAYEDLPIIPQEWKYQVLPDTKKQFDVLAVLMADSRVEEVVCATDAGREGELIFRLTYHLCGCKKPVKRLWISSMEESAIREGFARLRDGANYDRLYEAALCRAKADWLIGINGTRLFTALYGGRTLNVGRVMTPVLALLTEREEAIAGFQKEKFYTVELAFSGFSAVSGRFPSKTEAEKQRSACLGKNALVTELQKQEKKERPPKLYDLTSLQRDANRLFDYTAQQTLDYLQSLYEKRLVTYPRTDSRFLTEDMEAGIPGLCEKIAGAFPFASALPIAVNAAQVVDGSKVSDHHAILPTKEAASADLAALPTGERNILSLAAARLLCAVGEPYQYEETALVLECGGASFSAKGRRVTAEGWKAAERAFLSTLPKRQKAEPEAAALPQLSQGQALPAAEAVLKEGATAPPKRYTEDTLLSAMERAGAEEFAQIEGAERTGLGTPATRAGVIEKLVRSGFAERRNKQLIPTEKGQELMKVLPETLKSVSLTAQWEEKLKEIERGEGSASGFMDGIAQMTAELVKSYAGVKPAASALSQSGRTVVGICPRCGKNVVEGKKSFFCEGWNASPPCGFALWKNDRFFTSKHKELTRKTAAALLKTGRVHLTGLFSEKKGVLYDATIILDDTGDRFVHYKMEFDKKKGEQK